jgi:hypothetical protein
MSTRINPETGVIEEGSNTLFGEVWTPQENENGQPERVNPETGVIEEGSNTIFGEVWIPK